MLVNETKSEGLKREFNIAVPGAEIEESINIRLKELAASARLPGFRPGKAPVSLLRKKYGPAVMGEVLEKAVGDASRKIMAERNLKPAIRPDIKIVKFEEGGDLEFSMALEVLPEIKAADLSTIKLERLVAEPDEAEITAILERMAAAKKTFKPAPAECKAKNGDIVVIDFVGKVDDAEFAGGKASGYSLELGSGSFIPGFEDQLAGVKAGDQVVVKATFPKERQAAELAGKEAVFQVDVKEVQESAAAKIDDDLAKAMNKKDLDDLKKSIRGERAMMLQEQSRRRLKRLLLDILSEKHVFDVPEALVNSEFDNIWKQFEEQRKASPESFKDEDGGKSDEDHKAEFRAIALRRVRLALLFSSIASHNDIKAGQADIAKAIKAEAAAFPGREQEIAGYFKKTPGALEGLSAAIQEEKVVDFIISKASVADKKVSIEELMKDPSEAVLTECKDNEADGKAEEKGAKAEEKPAPKKAKKKD